MSQTGGTLSPIITCASSWQNVLNPYWIDLTLRSVPPWSPTSTSLVVMGPQYCSIAAQNLLGTSFLTGGDGRHGSALICGRMSALCSGGWPDCRTRTHRHRSAGQPETRSLPTGQTNSCCHSWTIRRGHARRTRTS